MSTRFGRTYFAAFAIAAILAIGNSVLKAASFAPGDELVVTEDTPAKFYDQFSRTIHKGEHITVRKYDPSKSLVYFVTTDVKGKPVGLNISASMVKVPEASSNSAFDSLPSFALPCAYAWLLTALLGTPTFHFLSKKAESRFCALVVQYQARTGKAHSGEPAAFQPPMAWRHWNMSGGDFLSGLAMVALRPFGRMIWEEVTGTGWKREMEEQIVAAKSSWGFYRSVRWLCVAWPLVAACLFGLMWCLVQLKRMGIF